MIVHARTILLGVCCMLLSFLVCLFLTSVVIKLAYKIRLIDQPDGKIKCHKSPTPYLGGLIIYIPFIVTLLAAVLIKQKIEQKDLCFGIGLSIFALVGLIDDIRAIKPWQKFLGQCLAVLLFIKGGIFLKILYLPLSLNMILSSFWTLALVNAFNLIDVMDGLTTIVAICASLVFLFFALFSNNFFLFFLLITFIGSLLAFFMFNKPSARIYLGDMGALFIGGLLASMPVLMFEYSKSVFIYIVNFSFLAIPILEVIFLILIRTYLGIPFYQGSPHHFSIYLQKKGLSKVRILISCMCVGSIFSTFGILFFFNVISLVSTLILLMLSISLWAFYTFSNAVHKIENNIKASPVLQSVDKDCKYQNIY